MRAGPPLRLHGASMQRVHETRSPGSVHNHRIWRLRRRFNPRRRRPKRLSRPGRQNLQSSVPIKLSICYFRWRHTAIYRPDCTRQGERHASEPRRLSSKLLFVWWFLELLPSAKLPESRCGAVFRTPQSSLSVLFPITGRCKHDEGSL